MCKCTKEFTVRFTQTIVKEMTITASDIDQAWGIAEDMAGHGEVEWDMEDITNAAFNGAVDFDVYE